MASVRLDFVPPQEKDIVKLIILQADVATGPFSSIEEVEDIGEWPSYISSYTTALAAATDKWFSIQWEDHKGAQSDQSSPIQGGTDTVVNQIINRVLLRDASLDEKVVSQEVESVVYDVFDKDPFTVVDGDLDYKTWRGVTNLALARSYLTTLYPTGRTTQYVAGLVSEKTASAKDLIDLIGRLLKDASNDLGIGGSTIARMVDLSVADGSVPNTDISRLLISLE